MKTHLNLLSHSFCRRQVAITRLRQWCVVWLVAAAVGGGVIWMCWQSNGDQARQIEALERKYQPVAKQMREITILKEKLAELQVREKLTLELAQERPMLTLLGHVSQAASECGGKVSVQSFRLDQRRQGGASELRDQNVLTLSGVGTDNLTVARFVVSLRDAGIFEQVQLKSTGVVSIGEKTGRAYVLECSF